MPVGAKFVLFTAETHRKDLVPGLQLVLEGEEDNERQEGHDVEQDGDDGADGRLGHQRRHQETAARSVALKSFSP